MVFAKALRCYPALRKEFEEKRRKSNQSENLFIENGEYVDQHAQSGWRDFYSEKALVAAGAAKSTDTGPWRYHADLENTTHLHRHYLESDDSTHDVRMYINGDFSSPEQMRAYGEGIAAILNGMAVTPFNHARAREILVSSMVAYGVKFIMKEDLAMDGPSISSIWESCERFLKESEKAPTPDTIRFYQTVGFAHDGTIDAGVESHPPDTVESLLNAWWLKQINDEQYMARMLPLLSSAGD